MMIGKVDEELDPAKLDELCQKRAIRRCQEIRHDINLKLDEIARMFNTPPEEGIRPYGVPHEGQAYDVWEHILTWTTDPTEIKQYWKVSDKFRDILRVKYIETRLPEIVKLILDKRPNYLLPDNAKDDWRIPTLLSLRRLSSQCKRSVSEYSGSDLAYLRIGTIGKVERITGTLMGIPTIAASLFPVNVIIDDKNVQELALGEFHLAVTILLSLVGHRIHFFKYHSALVSLRELYDILREWMTFMPNLTHFSFRQYYRVEDDHQVVQALEDVGIFPPLPKLLCYEEISIELPAWFVQRILEASPRIRDLRLLESFEVREHSPQVLQTLGDLTSLQMYPTLSLMNHHHLPWKLNKLRLCRDQPLDEIDEPSPNIIIPSCRLFKFLKQFEATFEHLEVEMLNAIDSSCCADAYLELRNLKTLKMELHESFDNLNFLLYAERLEILQLKTEKDFGWNMKPKEELPRIIGRSFLGKSAWEVFPNLKSFRLETGNKGPSP